MALQYWLRPALGLGAHNSGHFEDQLAQDTQIAVDLILSRATYVTVPLEHRVLDVIDILDLDFLLF